MNESFDILDDPLDNISNESCTESGRLTDMDKMILGISGAVASGVSIVICILVIIFMIIFKKYQFSAVQRLIIYLDVSVLLNSINQLMQRSAYNYIDQHDTYCIAVAIFSQYSSYCILVAICCGLFELMLRIVFNKEGGYLEIVYILLIFVFSFAISWIPFFFDAYGAADSYCTLLLSKNCSPFQTGFILEAILWWVPEYATIIFALATYPVLFCIVRRNKHRYTGVIDVNKNAISEKTLEEINYIKWFPLLFVFLDLIPIGVNIYDFIRPNNPKVYLWILYAVINGIQGSVIVLFLSLDPKTVKRMTIRHIRAAFRDSVANDIEEYPARQERAESVENSHELSQEATLKKSCKSEVSKLEPEINGK